MDIYLDKKTIDTLMDKKSFRFYSNLLKAIAVELGEKDPDDFVAREKSNFSKMLKKQRTLNYNYIIPLERIFGVSMLVLTGKPGYEIPDDPESIPYLKPFRYFAYKDDPFLYEELEKMTTVEGDPILRERDEYGREFIDYVIEYGAINGVKYLIKKHGLSYDGVHRVLTMDSYFRYTYDQARRLALMLIRKKEIELFMLIFNPIDCLVSPLKIGIDPLFFEDDLLDAILAEEKALAALLTDITIRFIVVNPLIEPIDGVKEDIAFANPMAISLFERTKDPQKREIILSYMSKHNRNAETALRYPLDEYSIDSNGYIRIHGTVYGNVLLPKEEVEGLYRPNIKLRKEE